MKFSIRQFRRSCCLALVMLSSSVASALAAEKMVPYFPQPGNRLSIKGTSNMHDWEVQGEVLEGVFEFGAGFPVLNPKAKKSSAITVRLDGRIPVRSLHDVSHGRIFDELMYRGLNEPASPNVLFRLDKLTLKQRRKESEASWLFGSRCTLVVAGVTNQVAMPVSVLPLDRGKLKVSGSATVKLADFGVRAPELRTTSGSVIKAGDEVKVSFEWFLGPKRPE